MPKASFEQVYGSANWQPILNCPGRYVLRGVDRYLSLEEIAGPAIEVAEHNSSGARDTVLVSAIAGGGIISYRRADGSFLHTLNNEEGFERKLRQLGIESGDP